MQAASPVFSLSSPRARSAVGGVLLMLMLILLIEASASSTFFQFVTGQIPLTKTGGSLLDSLTNEAKTALAWLLGAFLLLLLAAEAPTAGLLLTGAILLSVLLKHANIVSGALNAIQQLTTHTSNNQS